MICSNSAKGLGGQSKDFKVILHAEEISLKYGCEGSIREEHLRVPCAESEHRICLRKPLHTALTLRSSP